MLIPVQDHNPRGQMPFFTFFLLIVLIFVFLFQVGLAPDFRSKIIDGYGVIPARSLGGFLGKEPFEGRLILALFTSMFLHASFLHLAGNLWFLWIFGDNVEDTLGEWRFLTIYFVSGLCADASHMIAHPNSTVPMIGASGAISGLMGSYLVLFPRVRMTVSLPVGFRITGKMSARRYMAIWFGFQILLGLLSLAGGGGGIAWWAHVGGFLAGICLGWWFQRNVLDHPRGPLTTRKYP